MKKIVTFVIFFASTFLVFAETHQPPIRQEVKTYLDGLYGSTVISIGHTTDSISRPKKRSPDSPKPFSAGRYKVVFFKDGIKKAMIFQTELKVGHIAPITPGKTDVGGYVEILKNPDNTRNEATYSKEPILNDGELDYLIRILYKNFNRHLTADEAASFNQVKDFALSIFFSNKSGIMEYHNKLKTSNQ